MLLGNMFITWNTVVFNCSGLSSVPVCRCIVLQKAGDQLGLHQFTSTAWMCHRAAFRRIVTMHRDSFSKLIWPSTSPKFWWYIFNESKHLVERNGWYQEKCRRRVTSSWVSPFNSSTPQLCQGRNVPIEHPLHRSSNVLGSDSTSILSLFPLLNGQIKLEWNWWNNRNHDSRRGCNATGYIVSPLTPGDQGNHQYDKSASS